MERYKLYLFDFDGTLADSFEALAMVFRRSFEAVGIKIKDVNNQIENINVQIQKVFLLYPCSHNAARACLHAPPSAVYC